jgi:hypothetical protein
VLAAGILITGVVPPVDTTGGVPETLETPEPLIRVAAVVLTVTPFCTIGTNSEPVMAPAEGNCVIVIFAMLWTQVVKIAVVRGRILIVFWGYLKTSIRPRN